MRSAGTVGLIHPCGDSANDWGGRGLAFCRDHEGTPPWTLLVAFSNLESLTPLLQIGASWVLWRELRTEARRSKS